MPLLCCCGNELDSEAPYKGRIGPCRCGVPGSERRVLVLETVDSATRPEVAAERRAAGLPVETDYERGIRRELRTRRQRRGLRSASS